MVVATVLAGCADAPSAAPASSASPTEGPFRPVLTVPPGLDACAGVLYHPVPIFLVADGTDVVGRRANGDNLLIYWPPGTQAVFDPDFSRVVDEDHETIATAGENIRPHLDGDWLGWHVCTTRSSIFFY